MAHKFGVAAEADQYFTEFRKGMSERRDVLSAGLDELGLRVIPSQGTYFLTTDVTPLGFTDGLEFCRQIPERAHGVAIPHQAFCDDDSIGAPYVRWAFCKQIPVLGEAVRRLQSLV